VATFVEKWEDDEVSLFIAKPQRSVLVCATNRGFLEQVLARMKQKQQDRALPDNLPEWRHVEATANVWAMRHSRKVTAENDPSSPFSAKNRLRADPKAIGFAFWFGATVGTENVAKCRYLTGANNAAKLVTRNWLWAECGTTPTANEIEPGVIEITCPINNNHDEGIRFLYVLLWYLGHEVVVRLLFRSNTQTR
jgi:hypothetical protein